MSTSLNDRQVLSEINRITGTHNPHFQDVRVLRDLLKIARERNLRTDLGDISDVEDRDLYERPDHSEG